MLWSYCCISEHIRKVKKFMRLDAALQLHSTSWVLTSCLCDCVYALKSFSSQLFHRFWSLFEWDATRIALPLSCPDSPKAQRKPHYQMEPDDVQKPPEVQLILLNFGKSSLRWNLSLTNLFRYSFLFEIKRSRRN